MGESRATPALSLLTIFNGRTTVVLFIVLGCFAIAQRALHNTFIVRGSSRRFSLFQHFPALPTDRQVSPFTRLKVREADSSAARHLIARLTFTPNIPITMHSVLAIAGLAGLAAAWGPTDWPHGEWMR